MSDLETLFDIMWRDYCGLSPAAAKIHQLLSEREDEIVNDHIALRTFRHPRLGLDMAARPFERLGYKPMGEYHFEQKKLYAKHWEHKSDPKQPKIFISELKLEEMPTQVQNVIHELIQQVPEEATDKPEFFVSGRPWNLSYQTYSELAKVSEYASWVAAYGFRPNHFTVFVNQLKSFHQLEDLNQFLKDNGYQLNASGGEIKGSAEDLLEQSSTVAEEIEVEFTDGRYKVPSVYYEFALRHAKDNGELYQGFVAQSADKIFESTDRQK